MKIKTVIEQWLTAYWKNDTECQLPNDFIEERFGQEGLNEFASDEIDALFKRADPTYDDGNMQGYHDEWESLFLKTLLVLESERVKKILNG